MRWLVRLILLVILAFLVTGLRERQADLAMTADDLGVERQGVVQAEGYVGELDARIDQVAERMRELDERVTAVEARHPDGIPAAERAEYERLLGRRNEVVEEHNDLVARRRSAVDEYGRRVATHYDHVADANALAEDSTPWSVVRGLWASVVGD